MSSGPCALRARGAPRSCGTRSRTGLCLLIDNERGKTSRLVSPHPVINRHPPKTPVSLNQVLGSLSSSLRTFFHVPRTSDLSIAFFPYLASFVNTQSRCSLLFIAFFQRLRISGSVASPLSPITLSFLSRQIRCADSDTTMRKSLVAPRSPLVIASAVSNYPLTRT